MTVFWFSSPNSRRGVTQNSASSVTTSGVYFPSGAVDGFADFFSNYLRRAGEPSLLAAAQDPDAFSYRLDSLAAQLWQVRAVRLTLNPDGSGRIFTTEDSGTPHMLHRKEASIPAEDVSKFLQLVEKAGFWSMPAAEQENADPHRRVYKLDASTWVFEGVRNGAYHVVLRRGLDPSPFTDMVRFLLKDVAKLR